MIGVVPRERIELPSLVPKTNALSIELSGQKGQVLPAYRQAGIH